MRVRRAVPVLDGGERWEADDSDDTFVSFVVVLVVVRYCAFLTCKIRLAKCKRRRRVGL